MRKTFIAIAATAACIVAIQGCSPETPEQIAAFWRKQNISTYDNFVQLAILDKKKADYECKFGLTQEYRDAMHELGREERDRDEWRHKIQPPLTDGEMRDVHDHVMRFVNIILGASGVPPLPEKDYIP